MRRSFLFLLLVLLLSTISFGRTEVEIGDLYKEMKLSSKVSYDVFEDAIIGYDKIGSKKKNLLTIIDYSKPSTAKRFYVLDLTKKSIVYSTYVSHGVNTGNKIAKNFSNKVDSRKSSLGFFLTNETYYGSNGYSLRLDGLEKGINDNARRRAIVIHGADYASEKFIKNTGRLGRSWGCPALPRGLSKSIVDTIKGGSVIFTYGIDESYRRLSKLI